MEEGRAIAQPDPLVGTTLLDRYRVLECIGAGAMGAVYRAQQVGLEREVALKVLKKQQDVAGDVLARFEREARALSALTHPNTVRVFDFGATPDGLFFLAMELLHGELASDRLSHGGAIATGEAIGWMRQVLHSLGEAHAKGIIHRDIKPDNIFLARVEGRSEPVAKVLDFGIAKSIEGERKLDQFETLDGTVFGTPRYMSPEQAQGKPLDHRTDLYAVGIVLYELLVGAPPFVDRDAVIVMAKHIREQPAPLRSAAPTRSFPPSLQRVLDRALHKSPEMRFQSAEAFDEALLPCLRDAELLEHAPLRARRLLAAALTAPRWARWTLAAASLAVVAAVTATVALVSDPKVARSEASTAPAAVPVAEAPVPSPAPTPVTPAPATHTMTLYSEPAGANVWRDERFAGVTPLPLEVAEGRSIRVRVSAQGFTAQTLDLTAGESIHKVKLERLRPAETARLDKSAAKRAHASRPRRAAKASNSGGAARAGTAGHDSYEKFSP
ncbi:MAG: serine/threonine-protein kinase [Polyangiales bacterium]